MAANFSEGENRYSQAGIAYKEGKDVYVIHSEEDEEGHNGVFKERLESFLDNSPIWAIYHYRLDEKSRKEIVAKAIRYLLKKIKFDNDFDLKDDRKMYCTEFIYKVVNRTLNKEIIHAGKRFMGRIFVTISDLYENNYALLVQSSHKKWRIKK